MTAPTPSMRRRLTALIAVLLLAVAARVGLDTQQRRWTFQASTVAGPTDDAAFERDDGIQHVWIGLRAGGTGADVRLHG